MLQRHSKRAEAPAMHQALETRKRSSGLFWFWLIPCMFAVAIAFFGLRSYSGTAVKSETDNAVSVAQQVVRRRIGDKFVARFAPREWTEVKRQGDQFVVSSWVAAMPKDGRPSLAFDYICTVAENGSGSWYVADLSLHQQ